MTKRQPTETADDLKKHIQEKQEELRRIKRTESELNLQMTVTEYINSEELDDIWKIQKACYDYIAQHRALFKDNFKPSQDE